MTSLRESLGPAPRARTPGESRWDDRPERAGTPGAGTPADGPAVGRPTGDRLSDDRSLGDHLPGEQSAGDRAQQGRAGDGRAPQGRGSDGPAREAVPAPAADGAAAEEEPAGPPRRSPRRLWRGALALAVPAACYALPVLAVATILSASAAGYIWDATARARRRTAARVGRLARLRAGLGALVAVPAQTVIRLIALLVALVVGYAAVLGVTWWSVVPRERALALPLGVLVVVASVLRARYASERRATRLVVAVLGAGALALVAVGSRFRHGGRSRRREPGVRSFARSLPVGNIGGDAWDVPEAESPSGVWQAKGVERISPRRPQGRRPSCRRSA
jgi:hypothetical protein